MNTNRPKGLSSKKALKASRPLKANPKPKKQKTPSLTILRRRADALFGHYVRLRDAEFYGVDWKGECISCGRIYTVRWYDEDQKRWRWGKQDNIGHFVGRSNYFLRYDEINTNLQCVRCNKWLSGNNSAYAKGIDEKYGDGTATQLLYTAEEHVDHKLTREQLEQVIQASKEYLEWAYEHERTANNSA